jgi:hypothetical protein
MLASAISKFKTPASCRKLLEASSKISGLVSKMPLSDLAMFRRHFERAKNVVILTGAGVSAESGVPTFRGDGGLWRKYDATR